jgi:hypothetical protein
MAPISMLKKLERLRGGGDNGDDEDEHRRRRKRYFYNYTVKQKIAIVQEAYSRPNYVRKFARMEGMVRHSVICKWKAALPRLKAKALQNPHAKTCNKGPKVSHAEFETEVKDWICDQIDVYIPVQTGDIINHVIQVKPDFKGGVKK